MSTITTEVEKKAPVVGVQVAIFRNGALLLGKRKNCFGAGTWGLPGGHLEFGESFEEAAARELYEETGIQARVLRTFSYVNTPYETTHYVQICVEVTDYSGEPEIKEPDRCDALSFFPRDRLPCPLFPPSIELIDRLFQVRDVIPEAGTLCMYLFCIDPDRGKNRFINYILLDHPSITLVSKFGRRDERRPRDTRVAHFDHYEAALDFLRADIDNRLKHGYSLYKCSGTMALDRIAALFPKSHSICLRSISDEEMEQRDVTALSQPSLFPEWES